MSMILNFRDPRGAETSTVSPFFLPMIALPTGDSFESLCSAGFASAEPTRWYSTVCFASTSRRRTLAPTETTSLAISFFSITRAAAIRSSSLAIRASSIACSFFASSYSAFSAMSPNSRAVLIRSAIWRRLSVERYSISRLSFSWPSFVRMTSFTTPPKGKTAVPRGPAAGANSSAALLPRQRPPATLPSPMQTTFSSMQMNLRESWWIGPVEVPSRVVLAPMAGVSVQAFRRQGRRFGAGLVCSEMVSCAGIEHRNERTLGYLRVASDEHPLAIQIFGSDPEVMAEAARMVEAVAAAVDVPVSVKMRRGLENGSRTALEVGPRLVDAGAQTLTLHPRSARQMYTGTADHSLTAELVSIVDVPVIASGDVDSRARAQAVLASTGCAAVMVGRAAQGNPWTLREIVLGADAEPSQEEVVAELILFIRETVRELGERRASGFLKKFYGWYLGRGRFPKPLKQELVQLETAAEVVTRLFAAAPGAAEIVERLEAELPDPADEILLDQMPISIYGGG